MEILYTSFSPSLGMSLEQAVRETQQRAFNNRTVTVRHSGDATKFPQAGSREEPRWSTFTKRVQRLQQ